MTERVHIEKRYGPRREATSPVEDSRNGAAQIRGKIFLFFIFIPCPSISSTIFWTSPNRFWVDQKFLCWNQNSWSLGLAQKVWDQFNTYVCKSILGLAQKM